MAITISALIPTYNRRGQVLKAIESVLAQSVPVNEIIVVDDGSTDGTVDAIRHRFGSCVRVLWQENAGVSAARNRGLREARGEWIALLDSDDEWLPRKIERQIEALERCGGEFGFCFTDLVFDGNPGLTKSLFEQAGFTCAANIGPLHAPASYLLADGTPFWTQTLLIMRSLLEGIGGFDEALTIWEDSDVQFRLSFKTRFCYVAEPLVRVDRTPSRDGLCNLLATRNDRKYEDHKRLFRQWLQMPEVAGGEYELQIRNLLRSVCYDSAESKFHELRIRAAMRELQSVVDSGASWFTIVNALFARKLEKIQRNIRTAGTRPITV